MNEEKESLWQALIGGPEWSAEFRDAINRGLSDAVVEHLRAGSPVYITDNEGSLCEVSPDRTIRRLTREELEQLIARYP